MENDKGTKGKPEEENLDNLTPPEEKVEIKPETLPPKEEEVIDWEKRYKDSQREYEKNLKPKIDLVDTYEEILTPFKDKLVKDPTTGKFVLKMETPKVESGELTEEELNVFDDNQLNVMNKLITKVTTQNQQFIGRVFKDREDRSASWKKTVEEFPEMADTNSELYKTANEIAHKEYAKPLPNGQIYTPPNANYDAAVKAAHQLKKKTEEEAKNKKGTEKTEIQNKFVAGKTGKGEMKTGQSDAEFIALPPDQQHDQMEKEVMSKE